MTSSGEAVEQMDVKPTMSLNNMDTSSCFWASIVSPILIKKYSDHLRKNHLEVF